jgi:hypothetical protein
MDAVWSQRHVACMQARGTYSNLACRVLTAMLCRYEDAEARDCITSHFRGTINAAGVTTAASTAQEQQQQQPAGVSVSAQLLVAADGYFSRVRRQCLGDGPPEVRGSIFPLVCIKPNFCTTALGTPCLALHSWQCICGIVGSSRSKSGWLGAGEAAVPGASPPEVRG